MTQRGTQPLTHSLESIYDVLQDRRRRLVLYYLRNAPERVSRFREVEAWIRERETETAQESATGHDELSVAATLHHFHLPKLADRGFIDYDWRTKTIRYRPDEFLEAHLNLAERRELN